LKPRISVTARAATLEPVERPLAVTAADRLLLIAPHPDDESLAAAGVLQHALRAGADLRVVYVTDGENNPWAQLLEEWRWPMSAEDRRRWGARRRGEACAAMAQLGLAGDVAGFLGLPDQGLTDVLAAGDEILLRALAREIHDSAPTVVGIPSLRDRHPDHSAIAVTARVVLTRLSERGRLPRVLHYLVHPPARRETGSCRIPLDPAEQDRKRRAILCHRTQLRWRRAELLATVRAIEDFESELTPAWHDSTHPISHARFEDRDLVFELARVPRPGLGPTVLRLFFETWSGALVGATLPFTSRREPAARLTTSGGWPYGEARLTYEAAFGRGMLRFTPLLRARQAYLKLERPFERRLGIFDEAGWRAVPVAGEE
jgi:LmbE family N-acetylglucosaminyl deacetylase